MSRLQYYMINTLNMFSLITMYNSSCSPYVHQYFNRLIVVKWPIILPYLGREQVKQYINIIQK